MVKTVLWNFELYTLTLLCLFVYWDWSQTEVVDKEELTKIKVLRSKLMH
jgi:hypothetical protein